MKNELLKKWPHHLRDKVILIHDDTLPAPAACSYTRCSQIAVIVNEKIIKEINIPLETVGLHELGHLHFGHHNAIIPDFDNAFYQYDCGNGDPEKLEKLNLRRLHAADCEVNSYIPDLQRDPYVYPSKFNLPEKENINFYWNNLPENLENENKNGRPKHGKWKKFGEKSCSMSDNKIKEKIREIMKKNGLEYGDEQGFSTVPQSPIRVPRVRAIGSEIERAIGQMFDRQFERSRTRQPHKHKEFSFARKSRFAPKILYAIDCSGSTRGDTVNKFFGYFNSLKREYDGMVAEFDTHVRHAGRSLSGKNWGGGTSFVDVLKLGEKFDLTVLFSDCEGDWPKKAGKILLCKIGEGVSPKYVKKIITLC